MSLRAPGRSRPRKLLILGLASLVWLLLAEGGWRAYLAAAGQVQGRTAVEARLDALIGDLHGDRFVPEAEKSDLAKAGMAIHPYQGYQIGWYTRSGQESVRYFGSQEAATNFDVVLIGGSVAAEFGNWSSQCLIPRLQQDPRLSKRVIRLHNVACPGHKQPQHALTLQWLLSQGWKPDAVILLDGFNELAVSAENAKAGVNPLFPYWIEMQMRLGNATTDSEDLSLLGRAVAARDEAEELRVRLSGWPIGVSALAGSYAVHRLETAVHRAQQRVLELQAHEAKKGDRAKSLSIGGPGFDNDPAAVQALAIEAWREGSLSMQAICRARGIPFLHVLQPAPGDRGSKPLTAEEEQAAANPPLWAEAVGRGYPRLREVGAELSRAGVDLLDATGVFAGHAERIYRDNCHFAGEGCAILGPLVAEALLRAWKP